MPQRKTGAFEVLDFESGSPFDSWKDCVVRQEAGELLAKLVIVDTLPAGCTCITAPTA